MMLPACLTPEEFERRTGRFREDFLSLTGCKKGVKKAVLSVGKTFGDALANAPVPLQSFPWNFHLDIDRFFAPQYRTQPKKKTSFFTVQIFFRA
jgi:hypothetical protein